MKTTIGNDNRNPSLNEKIPLRRENVWTGLKQFAANTAGQYSNFWSTYFGETRSEKTFTSSKPLFCKQGQGEVDPSHWRNPLIIQLVAALLLFFLSSPPVGSSQTLPAVGQKPAPVIGAPANAFDLKTLDGKPVGLETFRGKPLVINFFASWCDPCREEMPVLNQLASKSSKEAYAILGIAVEDTRPALTQYVEEAKVTFPVALDLNSTVKRAYHIFGPPATFFIDGKGVIRDMVIGPVTAERAHEGLKKAGAAA